MGRSQPSPDRRRSTADSGSSIPELASIHTALGDLARRVAGIAELATGPEADDISNQLYAVERALNEAHRRLEVLTRSR